MAKSLLVLTIILGASGFLLASEPGVTKQPKRSPGGPLITIYSPEPMQLELALDEVELDWSDQPGVKTQAPAESAEAIAGSVLLKRQGVLAVVGVQGVTGPEYLLKMAMALKAANPGAEAYLVLYEPGQPKSKENRRLLTREIGLVVEPGEDPQSLVGGLQAGRIRAVPGVPGGFVVEADDPLHALELAEMLRQRSGVQSAYPLMKQYRAPR